MHHDTVNCLWCVQVLYTYIQQIRESLTKADKSFVESEERWGWTHDASYLSLDAIACRLVVRIVAHNHAAFSVNACHASCGSY